MSRDGVLQMTQFVPDTFRDMPGIGDGGMFSWFEPVAAVSSIGDFVYYKMVFDFIQHEIRTIGPAVMINAMGFVSGIALSMMTLWILIQGYRIMTGQSRESMMGFVVTASRNALIVATAGSMALMGNNLQAFLTTGMDQVAVELITGRRNQSSADLIEDNLKVTQFAISSIDAVDVSEDGSLSLSGQKTRAMWMAGFGAAGPAVTAGALLLMYEIAMALFIGLGPLFILGLMFEQTKSMFWKWLFYGIGTTFSMAVLALMSSLAMKVSLVVASSFWIPAGIGAATGVNLTEGMSSLAMQQGGIGLLLTMLLISVPPIASNFFQGMLGNILYHSAFGGGGQPVGRRPGESGYTGPQGAMIEKTTERSVGTSQSPPLLTTGKVMTDNATTGKKAAVSNKN
ncbi:MAG: type IV secretion system protein [Lysobacteraceae bacterium]|nr:MAG: type IV secretion system protein [Xanthomonadaceae bacterium]